MSWASHFLVRWIVIAVVTGVLGYGAIFLFTRKESRARSWLLAAPNRIATVGLVGALLVWVAIATFNRMAGS
ncbi:hypothetical protein GCM10027430_35740 [Lysobacter tyrosinilyticus]